MSSKPMKMMLSDHFSLEEMTRTNTGLENIPTLADIERGRELCESVLDPIREHYGVPVVVSSGFRSDRVNRAAGGSSSSKHKIFEAVDFEVDGISNLDAVRWIEENIIFDQLILEFHSPKDGKHSGWIHVSYSKKNRGMKLIALKSNGETNYIKVNKF